MLATNDPPKGNEALAPGLGENDLHEGRSYCVRVIGRWHVHRRCRRPAESVISGPALTRRKNSQSVLLRLEGHLKLQQQAATDAIAKAIHAIRHESGLTLWSTPSGEYWIPDGDDVILPLLLAQEARNIYGTGEWGVQPGDVVLDVGAYIGTWTKQALARGAKQVIAIEPSPASVECLKRNLAAEVAAHKVIIYPKGIWDFEGALTLFDSGDGVGNSFVEQNSASKPLQSIPVTTIDKVAAELRLERVGFIKSRPMSKAPPSVCSAVAPA